MRKGKDFYRDIVDRQTEPVIRFLLDGRIIFANRAFYSLCGLHKGDATMGENFFEIFPKVEQTKIEAKIKTLGSNNFFCDAEHWLELKGGERCWVRWVFQPIINDNIIESIQAVGRETTERVKAEKELQKSEEKIKALINAPTDTAVLLALDWKVLAINRVGAKRFGLPVDKLIGQYLYHYLPKRVFEFRKPKFDEVVRTGKPMVFEDTRDSRILENHVYPLFDNKGKVDRFAVFTRDITQKNMALESVKKREAELKLKASSLEEANIALKVLLKKREEDKAELEEKVWLNIKQLVTPYLKKLTNSGLNERQMYIADTLESSLKEIISPLTRKMSLEFQGFTPTEIRVANFIQQGLTTKEIADFFNLSERTIEFHRGNIRKKLGIEGKKINLKSYLLSQ